MIERLKEIISMVGWDYEIVVISIVAFIVLIAPKIVGILAQKLDENNIIGGRGWLVIFLIGNIIYLFLLKSHYLLACGLGVFLSLSFYDVAAELYDFEALGYMLSTQNDDPKQKAFLTISIIMSFIYIFIYLCKIWP